MRRWTLAAAMAGLTLAGAHTASAQIDAKMLRYPDVSATEIVFVHAGDIWLVPKDGGVARRLASPPGEEMLPRFSPDGSHVAFSGNYDGNTDIYVLPTVGGTPSRLTYHPGDDRMVDWTPDGREILFASGRTSGSQRFNQLWRVSVDGGLPQRLPLAYGEFGAMSADGRQIAFQTLTRDFRTWKRYRGGMAPDIWLVDLESKTSRNLTTNDANDGQPMLHGRTLYFLSDRDSNMRANIWALDLDGGAPRQLTTFADFDVRFPAIGPSDIVFEAGGDLWRMSLADETLHKVEVRVATDLQAVRPHLVMVGDSIDDAGISPSGKRAVFSARGEIFTVPAEHGPVRNLTRSSGVAERFPTWSPDGKWIAAWSDASGEYQLELRAADGNGTTRTLTDLGPGFRYTPFWSPDSSKIAFTDQAQHLWVLTVATGDTVEADVFPWALSHPGMQAFDVSWSTDSRWLTWSRPAADRGSVIFIFDTTTATRHQVTSGFYDDVEPTFGADGDYLFFLTNRSFEPDYSDFDGTWIYANSTKVAAMALRGDVPSPLAPRNDVEEPDGDDDDSKSSETDDKAAKSKAKKDAAEDEDAEDEGSADADEAVTIDFTGLESRIVLLPPDAGNYSQVAAVPGKVLYLREPRTGSDDEGGELALWDLEEREEQTVLEGVTGFGVSADHHKLLVLKGGQWAIIDPAPGQKVESSLSTSSLSTMVDPRAEWHQIFNDVWRFQRDFFYDPNMHGLDWPALRTRYGALIDVCVTRWDVNFVIGELIGELSASHSYRGGGDLEDEPSRGVGLLGVDWELADGHYRIGHIVRAAAWETEARSPLAEPALEVNEGDYVLAVNGIPLDPSRSPYAAFDGLAGQTVALSVNSKPTADGAREVVVETIRSENRLRNLQWIESNRQKVAEASGGRIGYVFVPDTGVNGQSELVRQFYNQAALDGMIIDERFNAGGQMPDRFVELLTRRRSGYVRSRYGRDPWLSSMSRTGPTVMLVNSWAGSGGDAFPFLFRDAKVGPIIGTRTWGGLIGISGGHGLIDGGYVTVPTAGLYTTDGKWMLEGRGLEPDIEVVDDPALMMDGGDPQLDRAISETMSLLATAPEPVIPPAYEDRTAAGRR